MKKLILLLGIGVFMMGSLMAQADSTKNKPAIKFEKTTYDFGTISKGGNGTFEFSFKNEGEDPLVISNVVKQCGCTSADWIKEPVKKGGSGWVKITYNTKIVAPFSKQVTVYSNAQTPVVVLTFKGVVKDDSAASASASASTTTTTTSQSTEQKK
jgi:hypothetical protein